MCNNLLLIILFTNMAYFLTINANVLTTIYDVESRIETQAQIIVSLEEFIYKEYKNTGKFYIIKKYLERTKQEHALALKDVEYYLGNPINAYTLIKRQTLELRYVEKLIGHSAAYKRYYSVNLTKEDLKSAIACFLRIQMIYHLNTTQLANGVLAGSFSRSKRPFIEHVTPMSASDCYEIGSSEYLDGDHPRAVAWLEEALKKFKTDAYDVSNITKIEVMYNIIYMYTSVGDIDSSSHWMKQFVNIVMSNPNYSNIYEDKVKTLLDRMAHMNSRENPMSRAYRYSEDYDRRVATKCRGENLKKMSSRPLTCVYAHWPDPFLVLARVKAEFLNKEPPVMLYHDVINDSEIEVLQLMAKSKVVQNNELLGRIYRRVEQFTGLSMKAADSHYVIDYGLREHHTKCTDFSTNPKQKCARRAATVKFFLSEVDQGGATIFVHLRLTVYPVKGAALFWMNLLPSGKQDTRVFHATCPVMRGNKWVLTNWLYDADQELRRPCAANGTTFIFNKNILL